ncbi:MAG TPA: hypothetical protein VFJ29_07120, partial [Candidatus Kapabacteria bacterium]|nr:hypothetical protein [Candidatus Kapabacteria bacterium]
MKPQNLFRQALLIGAIIFFISIPLSAQNFWQRTNGPYFYPTINSMGYDAKGNIYAAIYPKGVYRSSDNGTTWKSLSNGLDTVLINYNRFFRVKDNTLFLQTTGNSFFTSTDNGDSWKLLNYKIDSNRITAIVISDSGYIFAGTRDSGVYLSKDKGKTWKATSFGNHQIGSMVITAYNHLIVTSPDMSGNYWPYVSTDNGNYWQACPVPTGSISGSPVYPYTLTADDSGYVFIGSESYIGRSTDGGFTWEAIHDSTGFTLNIFSFNIIHDTVFA